MVRGVVVGAVSGHIVGVTMGAIMGHAAADEVENEVGKAVVGIMLVGVALEIPCTLICIIKSFC